ncbi:unnamed protein product [Adineta ricciae]|uniref:Uncharacterized protein n=1 Tax=Adineta ricciae TaxID=249248 RepID=A0A813QEM0_ADIRI|nr:unnamed protein product [Adineta ricciae]
MQQVQTHRDSISGNDIHRRENSSMIVRTDLSSLITNFTNSQQVCNDRLQSLERELATLKGQVTEACSTASENELNRTFTTKKSPNLQPSGSHIKSPSRIPLPITPRKLSTDEKSVPPTTTKLPSHLPPAISLSRSKTFHNETIDGSPRVRSQKGQRSQTPRQEPSTNSDVRIPCYSSIEEVIKANEALFLENDRLRADVNRLKAENIVLLRSVKGSSTSRNEPNIGTDRILAEREYQELTMDVFRLNEENRHLRKSLLAQSTKLIRLRQSIPPNTPSSTYQQYSQTSRSVSQASARSSRPVKPKSARYSSNHRGLERTNTVYHSPLEHS